MAVLRVSVTTTTGFGVVVERRTGRRSGLGGGGSDLLVEFNSTPATDGGRNEQDGECQADDANDAEYSSDCTCVGPKSTVKN